MGKYHSKKNKDLENIIDKELLEKEEYISHLKVHSQKLLVQIKKSKDKKQYNEKLGQETQYFENKFNKNVSEKG